MGYQCGDLLLARTLCLVYSICKIELCICLVVYRSMTMYRYHSKERTSDGLPCIRLYNTRLFSLCLVIFLGKGILLQPPIHFGRKHSYNTRCSPWLADIFKFKKNFSQQYFWHQTTVWWNLLPSTLFDDISNFMIVCSATFLIMTCPELFFNVVCMFVCIMCPPVWKNGYAEYRELKLIINQSVSNQDIRFYRLLKDVNWKTCLKRCRKEKKSMIASIQ